MMPNNKRPANDTPFGGRESPSSGQAGDRERAKRHETLKRVKSVVAGMGLNGVKDDRHDTFQAPTAPRHHVRAGQPRIQRSPPRRPDRWVPPQASLGGRLGEQVDRQFADLENKLAEANGYTRWLETELRARDRTIRDLLETDHGDELKKEQHVTTDLRAEIAKKNEELSVKNKALLEKDTKFEAKQKQLNALMMTKENEVDQKLKALAQVREMTKEVKKNGAMARLASGLVESNTRGEWKRSGEMMEDLVAAVKDQEPPKPQAASNSIDLTGEDEQGPYRVSLESSITNRFRRDD
ncbi:hypothetical protein CLAFUW4_02955 [Fulvia fulva]|uniref:Uncharacterized protein n=1 Tax=Passalora fulva TaxID=5499 RepID=A0A9Q8LAM8_PASFU|nr:uncharacterized protein CLAFUR5_02941 [Fulvia fulva]KAK4632010.1 hypothetical protein CLAFUR4_02948 [Fulvia fulva]KAK4633192.1 hypothetical protein CLAFUR0_02951 [Fulvia fulva]UJO13764.1 hypothetical protein CLAFUR5_02941 [Fulvia fulva]WPV11533.1 hypothetical protein CLAFUW4_02955 [Fulvia fulva]WPV26841.1 hypothetical protein CLAFUW7_02952 [Fulvia fulva]